MQEESQHVEPKMGYISIAQNEVYTIPGRTSARHEVDDDVDGEFQV